ncbi:MAG TPA: urate hydroxylase PuuD [Polyangiaceae bacterium]|nr:urate hydroxylase PuuD [Polyangiaceae bacterium]
MDPTISEILNLIFRWIHVVAGVMWIGHLWFFNFVNAQVAKTYDADSKKKVIPELMPRALYWFRWGAAYTWITGFFLLGIVVYMGGVAVDPEKQSLGVASGVGTISLFVAWAIYDVLWKQLAKNEMVGAIVSFVLVVAWSFGLNMIMSGRSLFIHIGATFGTIMAANVWMRIWPNQRKIIAAAKAGSPPPDGVAPLAALRSKHNTYMSVPLIFFMVSNHFPTIYGSDLRWILAPVFVAVGWGMTKMMYSKSAQASAAEF